MYVIHKYLQYAKNILSTIMLVDYVLYNYAGPSGKKNALCKLYLFLRKLHVILFCKKNTFRHNHLFVFPWRNLAFMP